MVDLVASYAFQMISSILLIITLLPQAYLNYRLKNTDNFSTTGIILLIIGSEVSVVYLIWSNELAIISVACGIFASIGLFIACQIKYYEDKNELILLTNSKTKSRLLKKRLQFLLNYIILLIWSVTNSLALYYIYELTKSYSWIPKLIGAIIPIAIDSFSFIPQIILIIKMKSAISYSLLSIIAEMFGSACGAISACLQDTIDIVPFVTFLNIAVFQLIIMVLKLCIFPDENKKTNKISPCEPKNDLKDGAKLVINNDKKMNTLKNSGLKHVSSRNDILKSPELIQTNLLKQFEFVNKNLNVEIKFNLDDEMKKIFENEFHAYHVTADQCDYSLARYFINQMENDDAFYIADISHCAKQYLKWKDYFSQIKPFYAVKTNQNNFIIKIIEKMGGGFDCASMDELETVLSVCPNIDCSKRIIYAHPCKPISHIKYFKEQNVELTVVDNENEMIKLKTYWPNAKILIRLKTNDSKSLIPLSTKFGANKSIIIRLFELAKTLNLNLIGCAFHVGTGCYDINAFQHALKFAKQVFDIANKSEFNLNFKILNIGGGFPGIDEDDKPTFSQMAKIINQSLNELFSDNSDIQIIAEPGRYFSAGCMDLVTTVIGCRFNNKDYFNDSLDEQNLNLDMNNIENVYYINEGIYGSLSNILYEKATYNVSSFQKHSIESIERDGKTYKSAVFGPTCDSSDCLSVSVDLPLLNSGDHLLMYHVGAYSNACSTKFNGFHTNKYFYIWKD